MLQTLSDSGVAVFQTLSDSGVAVLQTLSDSGVAVLQTPADSGVTCFRLPAFLLCRRFIIPDDKYLLVIIPIYLTDICSGPDPVSRSFPACGSFRTILTSEHIFIVSALYLLYICLLCIVVFFCNFCNFCNFCHSVSDIFSCPAGQLIRCLIVSLTRTIQGE